MPLPTVPRLSRHAAVVGLALLQVAAPSALAQGADPNLRRLQSEIVRLSTVSGGKVGVGIIHLETGRELFVNGTEPFPMASTVKVPIAVELLTRVQAGTVRLDSMITVQPGDLHPGSGTLTGLFNDPGVSLSVHNLTELIMLRCETGAMRLKGLLPPGVPVRHKTGSLGLGVANDVGIIDLPDGGGRVVVAVFVKESMRDVASQELAIAQIARAAYDYFLFNPGR